MKTQDEINALLEGIEGERYCNMVAVLRKVDRQSCLCQGRRHRALVHHPHAPDGCQGFPGVPPEAGL